MSVGGTPVAQPSPPSGRLGWLWRFGIGVPLLLGAVLALLATIAWLTGGGPPEDPDLVKAGLLRDFQAGQPVHFGEDGFWLVPLPSGQLLALADLETHPAFREQECRVRWRAELEFMGSTGWFRGDCSGSNFDLEGRVVSGPSPREMDRYRVLVMGQTVLVDMRRLYCAREPHSDYDFPLECVVTGVAGDGG